MRLIWSMARMRATQQLAVLLQVPLQVAAAVRRLRVVSKLVPRL